MADTLGNDVMLKDKIMEALQNHNAGAMYLPQIRHFLPVNATNGQADSAIQKLIKDGYVKKGDRTLQGYQYSLTTKGENYNVNAQELPPIEPPADFKAKTIVKNDLERLDGALSYLDSKHYDYEFNGVKIDPYRIFRIYGISWPEQQHAIKKLLRAGKSIKPLMQDIDETIATLERWKEILKEDNNNAQI